MANRFAHTLAIIFGVAWCLIAASACGAATRPNVLFIAVDDLRPELGCYGSDHVLSPNIDRLAASGRMFQRAYCQQAVCNPSRTSLMTGLRPGSIGVWGNHVHFRSMRPNIVTLPQHFKNNGYHAQSIGKIYHGLFPAGASKTAWDTLSDPPSWSVPTTRFGPRYYYTQDGIRQAQQAFLQSYKPKNPGPDDWTRKLVFGPMTEAPDVPDNTLYDGKVADAAIATLGKLHEDSDQPFFLAVGFIKPHTPFVAPKKYWDLYDPKDIQLAANPDFPTGAPALAGHGSGEVRRYTDQPKHGPFEPDNQRRLRHGYFACISYIDAQIGRVLDELDRLELADKTIVVLFGDHGWHLGEHGLWGKTTNFELDTRTPLIMRTPGMKLAGRSTESLAELLDVYPTLVELAGLKSPDHLEGTSLTAILEDPTQSVRSAAFSQYPRGGNADKGGKLMGYSMRTGRWRYTEWTERSGGKTIARELYDHQTDPRETKNLAAEEPSASHIAQLSEQLLHEFRREIRSNTSTAKKPDLKGVAAAPKALRTSFEECRAGAITNLESNAGRWFAESGHAEIDDQHHHTGKQCLHLFGGKQRTVEFAPDSDGRSIGQLVFQAERWTRRSPFTFRIQKLSGEKWTEIYNGDKQVVIGTFRTHVRVDLDDPEIKRFRFVCTSPKNSGLLIDDIELIPPSPLRVRSVEVDPVTLPALIGTAASPLLRLRVDVEGTRNSLSLTSIAAKLVGTTRLSDIKTVHLFSTGKQGTLSAAANPDCFGAATRLGMPLSPSEKLVFRGSVQLEPGANYFWIACTLGPAANIDHVIKASCTAATFSDGTAHSPASAKAAQAQRMGVSVRKQGDDGVHTYRIPGLVRTNRGSLIAVYDIRRRSGGDLPGDIDVGMSRSTDGGQTWEPMRVIMDMGDNPKWKSDGIGDPAVLVDRNTNTIWVAAVWSHGNRAWFGSQPGMKPEDTGQFVLVRSDDDGRTWSKPINITSQIKRPDWCYLLQGPGKGITMRDGTLVFAAQYQDSLANKRLPRSTIIYSRDHGKTWQIGTGAIDDTTESQVIEIEPGVLMLNCRYNRAPTRVVAITRDMGKTWQMHPTSQRSLVEPCACMASLIDVDGEVGKDVGGWLLFSNPDSSRDRRRITIKASKDKGLTWPKAYRLLLDEGHGAGYSCMAMIDEETVGILYEGSLAHLTFQRIKLRNIVGDKEPAVPRTPVDTSAKSPALRLPAVFGDHMVLQAGIELPVWGTARPGKPVTITLGDERRDTTADSKGEWLVRFPRRMASSKPITMKVRTAAIEITFNDVLIGEVWICAGQSNMEWPLEKTAQANQELASADQQRQIRLLNLPGAARGGSGSYTREHLPRLVPERFCRGKWATATADSARTFSAVGWFFGRELQKELDVPIGLINPAIGGTPTEAWIRRGALRSDPQLAALVHGNWLDNARLPEWCRRRGQQNLISAIQAGETIPGDELGPNHSFKPSFMWQAAIEPLIPYAIRGVLWYQGESNAESAAQVQQHRRLFPLMVRDWRRQWRQGDFPFLFVQLPGMRRPNWPAFREGQRRFLGQLPNVGMAVTIDVGHPTNVHPTEKRPVGQRLARWALGTTYDQKTKATYSGPLYDRMEVRGNAIVLHFDHLGTGLTTSDGTPPRHFEIASADGAFHAATATIVDDTIVLTSSETNKPRHARYAWQPFPDPPANLYNREGLPASPFSTRSPER